MREKFICAHFVTSWHCKIGSKAHFFAATPPHLFHSKISVFPAFPRFKSVFGRFFEETHSFFVLRSPLFSRLSSFWSQLRAIFRWLAPVFPRYNVYFLSHSPILNPISGIFSMARHSFQPRNSLFSCFSLYFPTLRALLREISPFIFPTLLFVHSVKTFPIRVFPFFILYPTFIFPLISFPPFIPPPSSLLPHFLSHSSPLFHLPPQLTHERAHPRALRAHAYTRTSGGFRLLPSPLHPSLAIHCAPMR